MKEYNARFSYYSEQYGCFESTTVRVEADNQFQARHKAWMQFDNDKDRPFMSCVKLCGITWEATPLDMQDYFNAQASYDKTMIRHIENVDIPNAQMEINESKRENCEREKSSHYGSLHTAQCIASDLGKAHGMIPPMIFEELHYLEMYNEQYNGLDFEQSNAVYRLIEEAEKWDSDAIFNIQELFRHGYGKVNGYDIDISAQFGRDGILPIHNDRSEFASSFIRRWENAREYKTISWLKFFDEKDVIAGSTAMDYEWQTLVLKKELLPPEKQVPENSLWFTDNPEDGNFGAKADSLITVVNPFTGEVTDWKRSDFIGVLRPEVHAKIDFDGIKEEYGTWMNEKSKQANTKKPSILADLENSQKDVMAQTPKDKDKTKPGHGIDA